MTGSSIVLRSLRYYWRANLTVLLGATVATAVLVGALAVGDSVKYSLRQMALQRLGRVDLALNGQSRFFRTQLANDLSADLKTDVAPIIMLRGTASSGSGDARANNVRVIGVPSEFWSFLPLRPGQHLQDLAHPQITEGSVFVNERLAEKLNARPGDEIVLRIDKPSLLSRDAPLSKIEDSSIALRVPVQAVIRPVQLGRFSLEANQIPPLNVFIRLDHLQRLTGMPGRANALLVAGGVSSSAATQALWKRWQFADAGLELRDVPQAKAVEIRTDRVFLEPPVGEAALKAAPSAQGVLTYFVNEIRNAGKTTPYSTVSALQGPLILPGMSDDEILINQWEADDIGAKPGDRVTLKYWIVGPMRKLIERTSDFRIRAILPMNGPASDRDLMPDIPGLTDKKNCRDWEPGVPIDLNKIRDKDQQYWDQYRGAPKAFITLAAGQRIWNNRFGNLTAVRFPSSTASKASIETCIRQALSPASLGLFFVPVREQALAAGNQSLDFGQLFLGFSIFLIAAALLLTALLFSLSAEQRSEEVGTLLALGFRPSQVRRMMLAEGAVVALIAAMIGVAAGLLYTGAVISALTTVWRGAVANSALEFHADTVTVVIGASIGFLVSLGSIWFVSRRQARLSARELLQSSGQIDAAGIQTGSPRRRWNGLPLTVGALGGAVVLVFVAATSNREMGAGLFFGAGALLLIGGIAGCRMFISNLQKAGSGQLSIRSVGIRNAARRTGRSVSAISLLACGSFLVIAVGANRHDPSADAAKRSSGTGGFEYYGESPLPVFNDLNTSDGRDAFGLDDSQLKGVEIVQMRVKDGDDASCLNLNRAQTPRLLGVDPVRLEARKAFTFTARTEPEEAPRWKGWDLLNAPQPDGAIPAIGDTNTVTWSLGKSLGSVIQYPDERGNTVKIRIVGVLANSILQGSLVISESNFTRLFPSESGYRAFLVDAKSPNPELSKALSKGLEDVGLDLTPSADRLAAFNTVENTYLSIFAILGGLGLLLGSFGLGVIVLRNVLERRAELALLRAVGFKKNALHGLVFREHSLLLGLGLAVGVISALVAVIPTLLSPGVDAPYSSLTLTLAAVLANGLIWIWIATSMSLHGKLVPALRNE